MATQSSILAWRTPWTEEPGRLQSIGFQRVRHDWRDSTCACVHTHTHTHTHTHIFLSIYLSIYLGASQMAQMVKNLPAIWETRVRSLGQKDPLKKQTATHSNIPLWGIPWMQESGSLQFLGSQRVRHDWATNTFTTICLSIDHLSVLQELGR